MPGILVVLRSLVVEGNYLWLPTLGHSDLPVFLAGKRYRRLEASTTRRFCGSRREN